MRDIRLGFFNSKITFDFIRKNVVMKNVMVPKKIIGPQYEIIGPHFQHATVDDV